MLDSSQKEDLARSLKAFLGFAPGSTPRGVAPGVRVLFVPSSLQEEAAEMVLEGVARRPLRSIGRASRACLKACSNQHKSKG